MQTAEVIDLQTLVGAPTVDPVLIEVCSLETLPDTYRLDCERTSVAGST